MNNYSYNKNVSMWILDLFRPVRLKSISFPPPFQGGERIANRTGRSFLTKSKLFLRENAAGLVQ
mgnify:CR=1 FL=1